MEDEGQEQSDDKTLRNDKGERVDELDLMGAAVFLSIQNGFKKLIGLFTKK